MTEQTNVERTKAEQTKAEERPVLSNEAYLDTFNAVMKNRVEKMRQFEAQGIEVYETGCNPSHRAADLQREYGSKDHEALEAEGVRVEVAGRLMAVRVFGKASFAKLKDATGAIQLHVRKDLLGEELYATYKKFDMGDIVWASGVLFVTNTGELTVRCETIKLLTKSLRPLPEKFHGLTDVESRLRQRYLDLMVNDDVRDVFYKRSTIIQNLRMLMTDRGFLEVETPMMHAQAGGAAAKPFKTHHNALSMDMYLRVAPELYLKRLIVGGFERVFELNRNFRNEGLSRRHNPEFTMMEFYMAYGTYLDLMDFIEDLVCELSQMSIGTKVWQWNGHEIDISGPWKRLRIREGVAEKLGVSEDRLSDREFLKEQASKLPEPVRGAEADRMSNGHLLMAIFEQLLEESLIQPTFVYEFPASVSPLARRSKENPEFVERFEIYAGGIELGNAFSELNDAFDQRQRFLDQIEAKLAGDEEAHPMDDDYVKALEFGMPPCAGLGLGIDRLIMMMTSSESIRDVILFPMMRPEQ